jgi:hypothetical protein
MEENKQEFKFDVNTVLYMLYMQYKANMISRDNLKGMLKVIKGSVDVDIAKYLASEAGKAV